MIQSVREQCSYWLGVQIIIKIMFNGLICGLKCEINFLIARGIMWFSANNILRGGTSTKTSVSYNKFCLT